MCVYACVTERVRALDGTLISEAGERARAGDV